MPEKIVHTFQQRMNANEENKQLTRKSKDNTKKERKYLESPESSA